jgi:hypothetical protein
MNGVKDEPTGQQSDRDTPAEGQHQKPGQVGRCDRFLCGHETNRDAVDDQRGPVVDRTLCTQRCQLPGGQSPAEGSHRRGVGGGDRSTDDPGRPPGQSQCVPDHGDCPGRSDHQERAGEDDPAKEAAHLPQRGGQALPVQQRRQEQQQHQFGWESHPVEVGNHAEGQPDQQQDDRNGHPEATSDQVAGEYRSP